MVSRLTSFTTQVVVSRRWSSWLLIASILIAVVAPLVLHGFPAVSLSHLVSGPLDPHPQG